MASGRARARTTRWTPWRWGCDGQAGELDTRCGHRQVLRHHRTFEFGRFAREDRRRRGQGKPETFDFLGFTHCCGKTRRGKFMVLRLTSAKRLRAKLSWKRMTKIVAHWLPTSHICHPYPNQRLIVTPQGKSRVR